MANGKLKAKIKSQLKDNITKQLTAKEKGQNHTAWGHQLKTKLTQEISVPHFSVMGN